jgi:nucleotide-binding universal stress UspA family protein
MRVVVGVDGSPNSIAALRWAADWARATGAHVRAIYAWRLPAMVVPPAHLGVGPPPADEPREEAERELASFVAAAGLPGDVAVEAHTREGSPAQALLDEAGRAGMMVVGARGHEGFVGLLLGSVATAVAHHAPCPVAVIPDRGAAR